MIHLRSGTTLPTPSSPVITNLPIEQREQDISPSPHVQPSQIQHHSQKYDTTPPFPQRLDMEVTKLKEEPIFDLTDQLKHVCVKIHLFQAIKDVPIYSKETKEACLKKPGRKKKGPQIVHVVGQLVDIMLAKVTVPKYSDPGSPVGGVVINGI